MPAGVGSRILPCPERRERPSAGSCMMCSTGANARLPLFESANEYALFLSILSQAHDRVPMRTIGYCLMPNHRHVVLRPREDGDLSEFMRWLTVTHTQGWTRFLTAFLPFLPTH